MEQVFQISPAYTMPFPERVKEEFEVFEHCITFNLSFEKIIPLFIDFVEYLVEPLFFVLEIPLTLYEEKEIPKNDNECSHKKVCYLDGQTKAQIKSIIDEHGEVLLTDGLSQFAVASHKTYDELFVKKYQVISLLTENPADYFDFLKGYGLVQTDSLVTAWDTFSPDALGEARSVDINGISIYDVYDSLKEMGLYDAKVVVD